MTQLVYPSSNKRRQKILGDIMPMMLLSKTGAFGKGEGMGSMLQTMLMMKMLRKDGKPPTRGKRSYFD
jgi:hypothetical protein